MHTRELFDDGQVEAIQGDFDLCFDRWIQSRSSASPSEGRSRNGLREASAEMYRDMWGVVSSWCADRRRRLKDLDEADLIAFLDSLGRHGDASPRYGARMMRLIARIEQLAAASEGRPQNQAIRQIQRHPRIRFADSSLEDPLPDFLTARQATQLIDYVTGQQLPAEAVAGWTWRELRDRTAVGMQLGAGITPGETRGLTLEQVVIDGGRHTREPWALQLPGNGNFPARQTPLAGWAGRLLARWMLVRQQAGIPGEYVFPSTRSGTQWGKASFTNACRDILAHAGLADPSGGSFRLRHTFALRQLTRHPPEEVARWLGLQDPQMMERYKRVIYRPVEIV